jgi:hypothetical protein
MTVIGTLSSFRKRGEMSPHKRASRERLISWRQADLWVLIPLTRKSHYFWIADKLDTICGTG